MNDFHWIRPACLWILIPFLLLILLNWKRKSEAQSWQKVCDAHLLPHLLNRQGHTQSGFALGWLLMACALLIVGLAGPSWEKLAVPSFQQIRPHILLLDMSKAMNESDVSPTRLERAKFIIHDLLAIKDAGQFALIAYTDEPFVVSPLTEDGNTIDALLGSLDTNIMPVGGHQLAPALVEAKKLIEQAGYVQGDILVLSANPPDQAAIDEATKLANNGIDLSVMPIIANKDTAALWKELVKQGQGQLLGYESADQALQQWLSRNEHHRTYDQKSLEDIPLWKDEGRWFILVASLMLLPVFRRGWLQRIVL